MGFTPAQQQAIAARGNVLVVAGAGTGKTSTLVERCLSCLLEEKPRASLDELLLVTFTEAAASDMRRRIRERIEVELADANSAGNEGLIRHWQEQLALFETAHIGTLHSFCLQLVRQHFYELELDPQFSVLSEEEGRLLADETLEDLLQKHYAGRDSAAEAVQQLIQSQGRGSDRPIRELVLRLHHYTQTLPNPAGWFGEQLEMFAIREPVVWREWLAGALAEWRIEWLAALQSVAADNQIGRQCAMALDRLDAKATPADFAQALASIAATPDSCPKGKKTAWVKPLEDFLEEADFLSSLLRPAGNDDAKDPLAEDWGWVREQMVTLLQLAREFTAALGSAKRELGMVDFHDLEQHALTLLWNTSAGQPTRIARQWRDKLRFVFVDEYQDINSAQDRIIEALCREGADSNRFLVGDVKQSIYRFRLANPHIFRGYVAEWHGGRGRTIPLVENFRSREGLLRFINSLFGLVMRKEMGGVTYDETARLQFGSPIQRRALSEAADATPRVELHLRIKGTTTPSNVDAADEAMAEVLDMGEADKEARQVALRLRELKAEGHSIVDEGTGKPRPVQWGDMAVLLRSPGNKSESYAKEFTRLGVPLFVARGRFYESLEISDLRSLLQLLDNPLQDLPAVAVLRSPLVGLTLDELAELRLAAKGPFWSALVFWHESRRARAEPASAELFAKVDTFFTRHARWRRLVRQMPLSRCLEAVLSETHYADWLVTQPRGEQRRANVQRLVALAQQFDQFQRQGLFRFLLFIEAQERAEAEPTVAPVSADDCVRLMSIHQSKGLEFPVVVVADMGKTFNLSDLRSEIILDEIYGLCPQIKPPHTGRRYPSLPYWLARKRQVRETLGEELRLLYVAMTRARDTLLLSGSVSKSRFDKIWQGERQAGSAEPLSARSYADWLGLWFAKNTAGRENGVMQGVGSGLRWSFHDDTRLLDFENGIESAVDPVQDEIQPEVWRELKNRFARIYPFESATRKSAKTSVTELRRLAAGHGDDETEPLFGVHRDWALRARHGSGADVGSAHHAFLQLVSLERTGDVNALKEEAHRLERDGEMTAEETALLDYKALAAFWQSDLGKQVRSGASMVRRELAFTARFSAGELAELVHDIPDAKLDEEFVVVQGVADLVMLMPHEIRLIDFKTDVVGTGELGDKVKPYTPQLRLYARSLARIYGRPVSGCWLYFLGLGQAVAVECG